MFLALSGVRIFAKPFKFAMHDFVYTSSNAPKIFNIENATAKLISRAFSYHIALIDCKFYIVICIWICVQLHYFAVDPYKSIPL